MATVKISRSEKVNNRHENISHRENISVTMKFNSRCEDISPHENVTVSMEKIRSYRVSILLSHNLLF